MKKVLEIVKPQIKSALQSSKISWCQSFVGFENDIEDLKEILQFIKAKSFRFQSDSGCNDNTAGNQCTSNRDSQKDVPKKRGHKTKTSFLSSESKGRSDSSDSQSLNSSANSTSSSRSRRAAAQAAEHKLAQVQTLVQLKTKLRRPTNFDEKLVKSSPPAKCRRTHRNQSAGSSSSQTDEGIDGAVGETDKNMIVVGNENLGVIGLSQCEVTVERLNTPKIKSFTRSSNRSSRSLERACKRKSADLFNDSIPLSELNGKHEPPKSDQTHITKKKSMSKRDLDSGISSTDELQLMKANLPIAHSSPISQDVEFKGFDDSHRKAALVRENTFIVGVMKEETQVLFKKTLKTENRESSNEETEEIETNIVKSKTKILRKKGPHTTINLEEKENVNRNNETHIISSKPDSPTLRSRTKVLKKAADDTAKNSLCEEKSSKEDLASLSSPENGTRMRTKTNRKHNEQNQDLDLKSDSEVAGQSIRSRTKTIKKHNEEGDKSDSTDNESGYKRSRTKTIRKGATDLVNNNLNSGHLISEMKNDIPSSKIRLPPISPAPAKGDLVKKRVEDFEKMQNGLEEAEEEKTVGRVTRNAMKSKVTASATETQSSKHARNMPVPKVVSSAVKQPLTPLGVNNRMTPSSAPVPKPQVNKWTSSANRPIPVETNTVTLIQKQTTEEAERKRKEEERLKRQAKEDEAKRKKEKALKATAEEAKRKRLEKLQKVAAAREAAEKEKERLAAKAEKEKEEKMRQIAIEKEKQKEEQLKKKHLMQQKTLEHEERRKQEEAARLAKIKEQEEEQKRLQAMKEREQELLKQQKAELRLAEAEKNKNQGGKLGKIAAVNNAKLKMQHGATPSDKTNGTQSANCYEITPAREDRPLLPPKSENDYGIDDAHSEDSSEDESRPKKMIPLWAQSKNRERILMANKYIPKKLWDLFMECDPCPDINKIFAGNPIKRRVRTSSAVWNSPPKYSRHAP